MKRLFSQVVAAIVGLWLATLFVPGVIIRAYPTSNVFGFSLTAQWEVVLVLGIVLGLLNYFLRPLLKSFSLPLEIISIEFLTIIIDMALIWLLDLMFDELSVPLLLPLLYTTLIIWGLNIILGLTLIRNKK